MTEKNGNLLNFDPSKYSYNPTTDTITSTGLIVAGNSPHATTGVSNSTLTGRQWGLAPRIGVAWSPKKFNSKLVVRAGWGMYYDRGEDYTYLSPGVAQSITPGGPFGINQQLPFVGTQFCPTTYPGTFQTCSSTLSNPWGADPHASALGQSDHHCDPRSEHRYRSICPMPQVSRMATYHFIWAPTRGAISSPIR